MSNFEKAYTEWLNKHISEARGERLRRLRKNWGYGEKLLLQQAWWPSVGNFDFLYPEFEFIDKDGNHYFIDLAYIRGPIKTAMESDSFGFHLRDIDRDQFSRGLDRQNEVVLSGWNILRFSIDKLREDPYACQDVIRRMLVSWYSEENSILSGLNIYQRELVRYVIRTTMPLSINEACSILGKKEKFTRAQLHSLTELGILESALDGERARIHYYRLNNTGTPAEAAKRYVV